MTKDIYTAALVIIGDEILSGRTQDKNIAWLAERLNDAGVRLVEVRIIPDVKQKIVDTVNEMRGADNKSGYDYVFTTGGIGPTHDDITTESIAEAFGVEVELHDEAYKALLNYYDNKADITESRKKMAYIPKGAALIPNPVSGAPGIHIGNVYVFAGVPNIMQAMFDAVAPNLKGGKPVQSRSVGCNIAESLLAEDLSNIQDKYPMISIGSYPKYQNGKFGTSLVSRGIDEDALAAVVKEIEAMVRVHGEESPTVE